MNDNQGKIEINNRVAVLVVSCDRYSDLWPPFFQLFFRFWPNCPFNIYLLSNNEKCEIKGINNILVGEDISWSDNLIKATNIIKEEYILIFIEDLFLVDFVKTNEVVKLCEWILQNNANYICMNPSISANQPFNEPISEIAKGTIYRASTVLSVWKKEVLSNLLKYGESAWEFEIFGTMRSDHYDAFYSSLECPFAVLNGVIKGKWQQYAIKKMISLGVSVDLSRREIMNKYETANYFLIKQRAKILRIFPPKYQRKIKNIILGGDYKYKIIERSNK